MIQIKYFIFNRTIACIFTEDKYIEFYFTLNDRITYNFITCSLHHVINILRCVQCTKMIIRTLNCDVDRRIKATWCHNIKKCSNDDLLRKQNFAQSLKRVLNSFFFSQFSPFCTALKRDRWKALFLHYSTYVGKPTLFYLEARWHIGMSSASHREDPGSNPSKGRFFRIIMKNITLSVSIGTFFDKLWCH